jgi:ubiquinone/menaquinone biosynthesis C-methylase UbiE
MKTEWDYTDLAEAYLKRVDYAPDGLDWMIETANVMSGAKIADIGAGVGHLAIKLVEAGMNVVAVEPNDRMREVGSHRTKHLDRLQWHEGTGEATDLASDSYAIVTFGSSFNVVDQKLALQEAKRIAVHQGWFACMWNHRDLTDPIQHAIEGIIAEHIDRYSYGSRREDQSDILAQSGIFSSIKQNDFTIVHNQAIGDVVEAWRSHGTLHRQAGDSFSRIVEKIDTYLSSIGSSSIAIPYTTRIWIANFA